MHGNVRAGLNLYDIAGGRKYLNASERIRFLENAARADPEIRLFCLMLVWTGGRISEILALTPMAVDIDSGSVNILSLKRRRPGIMRQVPIPDQVLRELDLVFEIRERQHDPALAMQRFWKWSRSTAWRRVKKIMAAAGIVGDCAMPKGLRHGFGVNAFQSNVPAHLIQRWLGHASLRTTAIYGDVVGADERAFASRMWIGRAGSSGTWNGSSVSAGPFRLWWLILAWIKSIFA